MPHAAVSARIRLAATEAGILPNDALAPLVEALAEVPDEIDRRNAATQAQVAQLLQRTERLIDTAEQAANKPLMTSYQMKYEVLPALLAAIPWGLSIIGLALMLLMFSLGMAAQLWRTPALTCADQSDGARICYHYARLPTAKTPGPH